MSMNLVHEMLYGDQIVHAAYRMAHVTRLDNQTIDADIGTVVEFDNNGIMTTIHSETDYMASYLPYISTLVGVARIAVNVFKLLGNFFGMLCGIYHPSAASKSMSSNLLGIARGAIELVPIVGNLAIYAIDQIRIKAIERRVSQQLDKSFAESSNVNYHNNKRYYFAQGVQVHDSSINIAISEDLDDMGNFASSVKFRA